MQIAPDEVFVLKCPYTKHNSKWECSDRDMTQNGVRLKANLNVQMKESQIGIRSCVRSNDEAVSVLPLRLCTECQERWGKSRTVSLVWFPPTDAVVDFGIVSEWKCRYKRCAAAYWCSWPKWIQPDQRNASIDTIAPEMWGRKFPYSNCIWNRVR